MSQTELTIEPPIEACANCVTVLLGLHCHACGQKKVDPNEFSLKVQSSFISLSARFISSSPGVRWPRFAAVRPTALFIAVSMAGFIIAISTI